MRPVLRVGRQHQTRDLGQPAHAGEQLAVEEAELAHGVDQQDEGRGSDSDNHPATVLEALEVLRMAAADGVEIDREVRRHQCFSCRPIRGWRTYEVSVSITDTVMTISTRMADTSE